MSRITAAVVALLAVLGIAATAAPPGSTRRAGDLRPLLLRTSVASTVSKAHLPLLVDLYWLRVLIGIGEAETSERNVRLAEYGEFLTDLDPRFFHAYYFVSLVVPYATGPDEYRHGDLALKLVRKGIKQFPDDMRLRMLLAFLLTYIEHDLRAAVKEFVEMSKHPDAPPIAIASASALMADEGRMDEAIQLVTTALQHTPTMKVLDDRRRQLVIEQMLRRLDAAIDRIEARTGHRPQTLDEVIAQGEWPADQRKDPEGGDLELKDGRAHSTWMVGRLKGIPEW